MNTNEIINVEALPAEVRKHIESRISEIFEPDSRLNPLDPIATTTSRGYAVTLVAKNDSSKKKYSMSLSFWQLDGKWGCTETTWELKNEVSTHGLI